MILRQVRSACKEAGRPRRALEGIETQPANNPDAAADNRKPVNARGQNQSDRGIGFDGGFS
jgi:hypothetical protein